MTEQKAGLDRELWARIGEIADAYSKKEMAADIAAASAWEADIQKGANIATELARQLRTAESRIEALEKALPVKDAEGLARVCMSFAADMLHKQDDVGQRFWIDQAKRLRAYVTLRGEEET